MRVVIDDDFSMILFRWRCLPRLNLFLGDSHIRLFRGHIEPSIDDPLRVVIPH
jgi:hypothetical protein